MVSSLSFAQKGPPEPQLIQLLLNTLLDEENSLLKEMKPNQKGESLGTVTFVGSFLLQLLLEHK